MARVVLARKARSRIGVVCFRNPISKRTKPISLAILIQLTNETPAARAFAVVVTVTVALPLEALLKSMVYLSVGSTEVTKQLAFGAFVMQENVTRPLPSGCEMFRVVVLAVLAPAVSEIALGWVRMVVTDEGKYCLT